MDEYEQLGSNSLLTTMVAGSVAGVVEHVVMYPIDSVKTRMQILSPSPEASYKSLCDGLWKMVSKEGLFQPVKGVNAVIVGAVPAHAFYFSALEAIKKSRCSSVSTDAIAACGATVLHDFVMVPTDVVKQRLQAYNSPYKTCTECIVKLYKREGIRPFYRSYTTHLGMNLPFHLVLVTTYGMVMRLYNPANEYNPKVHMVAGALGGGLAAAATTPFDVCKTVLNMQEEAVLKRMKKSRIVGITDAIRSVYCVNGFRGFFKGLQARVLYNMPASAVTWSVYELFKFLLGEKYHFSEDMESTCTDAVTNSLDQTPNASSSVVHSSHSINEFPFLTLGKRVETFPHIPVAGKLSACSSQTDSLMQN